MAKRKSHRQKRKPTAEQEQQHQIQPGIQESRETPQLLALQQRVGNQAVNRMLGRQIQRQTPEPQDEEVDFSNMGRGIRLGGHGNLGKVVNTPSAPVPYVQKRGPFGVEATISLTVNPPSITRRPAAEIEADHGRPGVAGWTTPVYRSPDPTGDAANINIDFTLDFAMEIAEEYTGTRGQILQDHEQGHVDIGRRKAQEHFVNNLKANLESQVALNRANVGTALAAAQTNFTNEEEADSQAYDNADYPRMEQAYLGARTPLSDLEDVSEGISDVAMTMRNFNSQAMEAEEEEISSLAQEVISKTDALTPDDLAQLQYNPEFKVLVDLVRSKIFEVIQRIAWENIDFEFSSPDGAVRSALENLNEKLGTYTWRAPE